MHLLLEELNFNLIGFFAQYKKQQKMIASPTALPQSTNNSPKTKLKSFAKLLVVVLVIGIAGLYAIWHFGSQETHKENKHPLYTSFEESPEHKKLLTQLQKSKLSVLSGKKEDGLIQFVQHYANKLSQANRPVFLEDYNSDHFEYYQIVREARVKMVQLIGQEVATGDWILQSQNGVSIPEEIINKIKNSNPNGKLLIVTTANQKVKGFKDFAFPKVKEEVLEKIIAKSFKLKPQVADILYDYFETPEKTFLNLDVEKFDQKDFLGQSHRPLEGLSKEETAILQTLCTKGVSKSKKESPKLADFGVIHFEGSNHWQSIESILNYELGTSVNCKNTVASELIIKSAENKRQKEEQERRAKEEAERKKEQERKAQEAKAKEEEKKKQEEEAAKAAKKTEKATKKTEKPAKPAKAEPKADNSTTAKPAKSGKPAKAEIKVEETPKATKAQPKVAEPATAKPSKSKK